MKGKSVHIVSLYPNGENILDRFSRILADGTGWTISDQPNPRAEINYNIIYIDVAQRFSDRRNIRWAAYFSHYEQGTAFKEHWWHEANRLVEIKTLTARQYVSMIDGAHFLFPVPVDQEKFTIVEPKQRRGAPLVGVSGFVDRSGRKGEWMVKQLSKDFKDRANFVASGHGWPVKLVNRGLDGLPAFYNKLNIYLCTSLIEGVPMPPLEALACGTPVVIPAGVGMLDDLPEMPGIYRFKPGDYEDLQRAFTLALEQNMETDQEALRGAVSAYTVDNFIHAHVKGLTKLVDRIDAGYEMEKPKAEKTHKAVSAPVSIQPMQKRKVTNDRGVYYVAFGEPARNCARGAIESFRAHLPHIPIALVSTEPLGIEDYFIQHDDIDVGARLPKVRIYELAPPEWKYVLYLDADTEVVTDSEYLFQIVEDGWDLAICKNPSRFHSTVHMVRPDNKTECEHTYQIMGTDEALQLNGGVFCFRRSERTKSFFNAWVEEWGIWGKRDQAALLRALWKNPLKVFVLGNEWNTVTRYDSADKAAFVLHYPMNARRWEGTIDGRNDSTEAWKKVDGYMRSKRK